MKFIYLFFGGWLFLNNASEAQTISNTANQQAVVMVVSENAARTQKLYWQKETQTDPSNVEAWLRFYQWSDRDKSLATLQKQNLLEDIRKNAARQIPNTWANYLIQYLHSGMKDSASLLLATEHVNNDAILMPYAIQYAVLQADTTLQKTFGKRMQKAAPLSPALYQYHLNCLMSAKKNADVYAKGLNDLVPLSILQQVFGIRKDIQLHYYAEAITPKPNTYLCLSLGKQVLEQYPTAMYTGLLVKILPDQNTMKELEMNLENHFVQTTKMNLESLLPEEQLIYRNYLPGLIMLYKKYQDTDAVKKDRYKKWINQISKATNTEASVQLILAQ